MFSTMKPEDKIGVVLSCIGSLVVGLVLMGLIFSFTASAYQAPWPAIAFVEALFVVIASWFIFQERYENDWLKICNFFGLLAILLLLIGTAKDFSEDVRYAYGMLIYVASAVMVFMQWVIALGVVFGILPRSIQAVVSEEDALGN